MALSVTDEIHKRLIGLFTFARSIIQRATSSPSRPAYLHINAHKYFAHNKRYMLS